MPHFFVRDRQGTLHRLIARDLPDAVHIAAERLPEGWRFGHLRPRVAVSLTEKMWLWRQLAELLADGTPLARALARLSEAAATGPARVAAARLADLCAQGLSLSEALSAVPGVADEEQIALIAAAERAGRLPQGVRVLAELSETDADTSADMSLRWIYPTAVAIFGLVVLPAFVVLGRVSFPNVSGRLWQELGLRREDLGYSEIIWQVLTTVPPILLAVAAALFLFIIAARLAGPRAHKLLDRLLYVFPGYGAFRFHRRLAIFFHALSLGSEAGLPDSETLALARAILGPVLSTQAMPAQAATENGQSLAGALSSLRWLPEFSRARLLSATAEGFASVAAAVGRQHRRLADYYARRFITIAEPAVVVVVALAVGAIAVATFGPITHLLSLVSQLGP